MGLGKRLGNHTTDHLAKLWHRFSWFGFCEVKKETNDHGMCLLKDAPPEIATGSSVETISDAEALLIKAMGLRNINTKNFTKAEEWRQVERHELDEIMAKLQ
ncbi:MAG TPA: hypothetical protein VMH80_03850 [Bryobacteraceae bacterium]|nr:hypothetical protein [Bryobacteraceae bacterium]